MILIEVRDNNGVVGRCDANCYEAGCPKCTCVCGGVNHGVGLNAALRRTANIYEDVIRANVPEGIEVEKVIRPRVDPVLFDFALPGVKVNIRTGPVTHKTRRKKKPPVKSPRIDVTEKPDPASVTGSA